MDDAIVHATAHVGRGCQLGHHVVVMESVRLGKNVVLGHNVVVHPGTVLADGVTVGDNSVLGRPPKAAQTSTLKLSAELGVLEVGYGTIIGSAVVLYVGTRIGKDCLIADQSFVRERSTIGDSVIVGRGVTVENETSIGSYTEIQSRRITNSQRKR